jgi:hypothetical protein
MMLTRSPARINPKNVQVVLVPSRAHRKLDKRSDASKRKAGATSSTSWQPCQAHDSAMTMAGTVRLDPSSNTPQWPTPCSRFVPRSSNFLDIVKSTWRFGQPFWPPACC